MFGLWSVGVGDIIMVHGMENRFLLAVSCMEIMWFSKWVQLLNDSIVLQHSHTTLECLCPQDYILLINEFFNH